MLSSRSTMDYDVVLGIAEDADEETIRSAFRALASAPLPPGRRRWLLSY